MCAQEYYQIIACYTIYWCLFYSTNVFFPYCKNESFYLEPHAYIKPLVSQKQFAPDDFSACAPDTGHFILVSLYSAGPNASGEGLLVVLKLQEHTHLGQTQMDLASESPPQHGKGVSSGDLVCRRRVPIVKHDNNKSAVPLQ